MKSTTNVGVLACGAAVGTACGAAATAAIHSVVCALGFTSVGITTGSTAAGMMSANAGSVAVWGIIATLQSIGAVGGIVTGATGLGIGVTAALLVVMHSRALGVLDK
jgi:hypothetical protein